MRFIELEPSVGSKEAPDDKLLVDLDCIEALKRTAGRVTIHLKSGLIYWLAPVEFERLTGLLDFCVEGDED